MLELFGASEFTISNVSAFSFVSWSSLLFMSYVNLFLITSHLFLLQAIGVTKLAQACTIIEDRWQEETMPSYLEKILDSNELLMLPLILHLMDAYFSKN